ncbi:MULTISPECIES: NAD(P)H-binding protein [Streptomyces]|uniref:NAD(P)-dependent oxidoreductase n=1 Tax=Streptomyces canarius TaxID=285453 RepID=A0ABQ3D9T9_9ACTN|nr:NAD(P)H-binding protein [Streptomyces canarius]GHA70043.1 NAD(P)-dependent oxidoreductase [Streptomyces canarius]
MIAVSAASGAFGRLVVDHLLARCPAEEVVVAVRAPDRVADLAARGVQVRRGDYDVPDTLRAAFKNADRLLLISSPELDCARRIRQHQAAIEAARAAGVGAVVYTSFLDADTQAEGVTEAHHATERALQASGLPHTLLRHPFYSEAFLNSGLRAAVVSGALDDATGGRGINTASRSDLAEAAARVLTEDGHLGRAYDFTGILWTYLQLAQVLTRVCGTTVLHRVRDSPTPGAQGWLENQVRRGVLERQTDDLHRVLGHLPTTLDQAVAEIFVRHSADGREGEPDRM